MLHAGLDLSRKRVDVCLISDRGEPIGRLRVPADRDGLYGLARSVAVYGEPVGGVVEYSIARSSGSSDDDFENVAADDSERLPELARRYLKHRHDLGWETLCREISDSFTWRRFCRIALDGRVPDPSTLMKLSKHWGRGCWRS